MRAFQVFASMSPERARDFLRVLSEEKPSMFAQALAAASAAMKARPVYLLRQPFDKRAEAVRRALSRVAASDVGEELLAVYFLECKQELLVEWLDAAGVEHDEGTLERDPPQPSAAKVKSATEKFRKASDDPDRELLLRAFAAQGAVVWPDLEALFGERF